MSEQFTLKDSTGKRRTAIRIGGRTVGTTHLESSSKEGFEGLPTFRLEDGRALNRNKDGTFEIVGSGEVLHPV